MSEEKITPAKLVDGEPVIAPEVAEAYEAAVAETKEEAAPVETAEPVVETKVEEVAADLGITASAPVLADETTNNVVASPTASKKVGGKKPALGSVADGVIGSTKVEKKESAPAVAEEDEKVAIFSPKNISWVGVGKLRSGYNIVSKKYADAWLTRKGIRLATPEEVAKEYNK